MAEEFRNVAADVEPLSSYCTVDCFGPSPCSRGVYPIRKGSVTLQATIHDFAMVTYAVPSRRFKPLMTSRLRLETLGEGEAERALITTACFRLSLGQKSPRWLRSIHVAAHWTYATRDNERAVYLFRATITPSPAANLLRLICPSVETGREPEPASTWRSASAAGQDTDIVHQMVNRDGRLDLVLHPASPYPGDDPSPDLSAITAFIAGRQSLYFWLRGRWLWKLPVIREGIGLRQASPDRIRIPLWQKIGVLSSSEIQSPALVLAAPSFPVTLWMPRPNITI